MINPKILVTGATGRTGGAEVPQLLAKGYPVRAGVSRIQSRARYGPAVRWNVGQLGSKHSRRTCSLCYGGLHSGRCTELSGQRGATNF